MAMAKYLNSAKKYTTPLELGLPALQIYFSKAK